MSRYDTGGLVESMFEPGSNKAVLKNRLGIIDKKKMDEAESRAYLSVFHRILEFYDSEHNLPRRNTGKLSTHGIRVYGRCFDVFRFTGIVVSFMSGEQYASGGRSMPSTRLEDITVLRINASRFLISLR